MTSTRIDFAGARINRNNPIQFRFNAELLNGFEGDTLASALLANNQLLLGRSLRYHRPRGIVTCGIQEPSELVQLAAASNNPPLAKTPEIEIYEGLSAKSSRHFSGVIAHFSGARQWLESRLPVGFQHTPLTWLEKALKSYEKWTHTTAQLGKQPLGTDSDRYVHQYIHCEVLIVGAGIAGLMVARSFVNSGARVLLCELSPHLGGNAHRHIGTIDGKRASVWVKETEALLATDPNIQVLRRTTALGQNAQGFFTLRESLSDHLPIANRTGFRARIWKVVTKQTLLATGAHERPLVFDNNDLPGVMLSSAMADYAALYGVRVGKKIVIATNNDTAYQDALILNKAGAEVTVLDTRTGTVFSGSAIQLAVQAGVEVFQGITPVTAQGEQQVSGLLVMTSTGALQTIACDAIGMAGGWNPIVHLHAQAGGKIAWNKSSVAFKPAAQTDQQACIGACNGTWSLAKTLLEAQAAAQSAATAIGLSLTPTRLLLINDPVQHLPHDFWIAKLPTTPLTKRTTAFVDLQNDISVADIALSVQEDSGSIEHTQRHTTIDFAANPCKFGDINAVALAALALNKSIDEVDIACTNNRLASAIATSASIDSEESLEPVRTTCAYQSHKAAGAVFEDIGQWRCARYFPEEGETMEQAIAREIAAVRHGLAIMDASSLGTIEINGPDADKLLRHLYTNAWPALPIGHCCYGAIRDEAGLVLDDGIIARLGDHQYWVTTTTGNADRVMTWMTHHLTSTSPTLQVYLTMLTDHCSTFVLVGKNSRAVLDRVGEQIDTSDTAFPLMSWREGHVCGVPARIVRVSVAGELAYEINVVSDLGASVWLGLIDAGQLFEITPYGTETLRALRTDKSTALMTQNSMVSFDTKGEQ